MGVGVEKNGAVVGEDEEVTVGGKMDERVEIVFVNVCGFG